MQGVNKVILIGNVGKDPDVKYLDNGVRVANFPLATTETYKNKSGEKVSNTEWHNIVLWRGLAEIAENYIKKGKPLYIEGKIRTRQWEDKDGNKRYTTEILGDSIQMLGRAPDSRGNAPEKPEEKPSSENFGNDSSVDMEESDDLPF